tara:strand:- start:293 stop:1273 length:981 start_codon:yes stop_codon:yes gene_type:complete
MDTIKIRDIEVAYNRIKPYILNTPLIVNENINKLTKANVFFKLENLQYTGSFKLRGACNKILQLSENQKSRGLVAYSSGNHAQAVAYASNLFDIDCKIVMPDNAPKIKIENTKKFGAKIKFFDYKKESREKIAEQISKKEKRIIIKPYDDLEIIKGQGTAGKEIVEELKKLKIIPDVYLCCCGGGGLIAGTSSYIKSIYPKIKNFSVEPESFNDTQLSLKNNKIFYNHESSFSICDALLAPTPGKITFPINKKILSGGLSVSDEEVKNTIINLAENLKMVVEPGGAVAATALLNKKIEVRNKNVIVMISGGNIDYKFLSSFQKNLK